MFRSFLPLISITLISACSTIIEGATQDFTVLTPGAEAAECFVENEDMKYRFRSGETREIMKSPNDLTVTCHAPGNRQKSVIVPSGTNDTAIANVSNAGVGVGYDHFARGLYTYPDSVTVDFSFTKPVDLPLPAYHNTDVRDPALATIEYYGPGVPMVEGDKWQSTPTLKKREGLDNLSSNPFYQEQADTAPRSAPVKAKSLPNTADDLHQRYNPHIYGGADK